MSHNQTYTLMKMLKICTDTLSNNSNLDLAERQQCLNVMENILRLLKNNSDVSVKQKHIIDKIMHELDILNPVSYMHEKNIPFFICKTWVRF